jgi:hypothetical protein
MLEEPCVSLTIFLLEDVMVHEDEDEDPQLGFAASSSKYLKAALIGVWMLFLLWCSLGS